MTMTKVLICDDHEVVRAGLRLILENQTDLQIVGEAKSGEELIQQARQWQPDLVITDLSMPGLGGLEAIPRVRAAAPQARVLILTVHDDEAYFFQALEAGAEGYVLKGASADELLAAVRLLRQGGVPIPRMLGQHLLKDYLTRLKNGVARHYEQLSPREREVLRLVAEGQTNRGIALHLSVSVRTVERLCASTIDKLGLHNRAELIGYAARRGLLGDKGKR